MGTNDPHLNAFGQIDFWLQRQIAGYKWEDPPPDWVKPIPLQIIQHLLTIAHSSTDEGNQAITDMIVLAFFYLLRPGKYTGTATDNHPFCLEDVQLWIGQQRFSAINIPLVDLSRVTFATLTFTTQKNAVCGEVIGLARSGDPLLCPVLSLTRRIRHLRQHNVSNDTPLATYFHNGRYPIKPTDITSALRTSISLLGPTLGFLPQDITTRSLRAAGAMALLCAQVDSDIIRLLGRWRSDEMLR